MLNTESNKEKVWCLLQYLTVVLELLLNPIPVIHTGSAVSDDIPVFITRHSLVKAKGDVLVLLYGFLFVFFCQWFLDNQQGQFTPNFACGRTLVPDVSSPRLGVSSPGGEQKRGKWNFREKPMSNANGGFVSVLLTHFFDPFWSYSTW